MPALVRPPVPETTASMSMSSEAPVPGATVKVRVVAPRARLPLSCARPVVAAVKVTLPPRVRVPVPELTTVVKPATGVMPSVPMVRLPPPAVLMTGVGFVVVAPVESIETLPMVSVLPLKSRMPRPRMLTAPVPIMLELAPVY